MSLRTCGCNNDGMEQQTDPKHRGCINELRATAWLIGLGYEVCRNVSQHGPVDLVAIRGDEVILVDVKGTSTRPDGTRRLNRKRTPIQEWLDVRILLVSEDEVFWAGTKAPAAGNDEGLISQKGSLSAWVT